MNDMLAVIRSAVGNVSTPVVAEHPAIASARTKGRAQGREAAETRMVQIMGAECVAGDGRRMAMALDLAAKAPDMSATAVIDYVRGMNLGKAHGKSPKAVVEEHRMAVGLGGLMTHQMSVAASPKHAADPTTVYAARRGQDAPRGGQ